MQAQKCSIASLASTVALVIHSAPTLAASLYSVDLNTDQLVTINSNTGNVRVIGNLGFAFDDLDLAFLGDTLYGLAGYYQQGSWALYELNTTTGTASLVANLPTVELAEGLTSQNGNLIVGFNTTFNTTSSALSDTLAELSLTGALTNITSLIYPADTDGLTTSPTNQLYAVDYQTNVNSFFTPGSTLPSFGGYVSSNGLNDLAFVGNELFGISNSSPVLATLNSADGGLIQELLLDRPGTYHGLASSEAVPEPSMILGSLAIAALGIRLKYRKGIVH